MKPESELKALFSDKRWLGEVASPSLPIDFTRITFLCYRQFPCYPLVLSLDPISPLPAFLPDPPILTPTPGGWVGVYLPSSAYGGQRTTLESVLLFHCCGVPGIKLLGLWGRFLYLLSYLAVP